MLEITYVGEEGTGIGPTLEYYSLLGKELSADQSLWRINQVDGMLMPRPQLKLTPELKEKYMVAGQIVARSLLDDRLIDLPLSPVMWSLMLGHPYDLYSLQKIDPTIYSIYAQLQQLANKKREVDTMEVDQDEKNRLFAQIRTEKGTSLQEYGFCFYDPLNSEIELIPDGANVPVTLENLQQYIDLVVDQIFNKSIKSQLEAFKKGFNQVIPLELLRHFDAQTEIDDLVCGSSAQAHTAEEWTDINRLIEVINTAHGFTQSSPAFLWLLQYISEIKPQERTTFVQFLTGSPRLPMGGFSRLDPKLTIVLKKPMSHQKEKPDDILPSVMTCQNYVKMPAYTSYEALKRKFDLAVREGSVGFTLS